MFGEQIPELSPENGLAAFEAGEAVFVDIRDPGSYRAGHVPGAVSVGDHNVGAFLENVGRDVPLVVVCYHGHSSMSATQFFLEQGFTRAASLTGGFTEWAMRGYPSAPLGGG